MRKIVLAVVLLSLGLGVLFWRYSSNVSDKNRNDTKLIELTFWGLGEDEKILRPILENYTANHPKVKVNYVKQSPLNYPTRVQTQIRAGQGPDIFPLHSSWLPLFLSDLTPAPKQFMTIEEFSKLYYPIAKDNLVRSDKIYALPLEVDGLALYYNEEILKAVGAPPPTTWQDFKTTANLVTVRNQEGKIQTAGAAMGSTNNIDFWPEIIGLLFYQQPNGNLSAPANKDGVEVLQFYTSFILDPRFKTWDVTLPSSTQMFTEGKLAFYFAPAGKAHEIKLANPVLPFKVTTVPKLPGRNLGWGSFWAEGVSAKSNYPKEAWELLKFLNSPQVLQVRNKQRNLLGISAKPYPRVDMAILQQTDPIFSTFVTQAPFYKSGYLNSGVAAWGISGEMVNLYKGAIDAILGGQDPQSSLQTTEAGVKQVLDKYKVQ